MAEKDRKIKELEEELELLNEFKANRTNYFSEIEHYQQVIEETKKNQKEKIARLEQKFYDEKVSLQKQFATKLQELKQVEHEEAVTTLGETTKQLFVENR